MHTHSNTHTHTHTHTHRQGTQRRHSDRQTQRRPPWDSHTRALSCRNIPVCWWLSPLGTGSGGPIPEAAGVVRRKRVAVWVQPGYSDTTAQQPEGPLCIPETASPPLAQQRW